MIALDANGADAGPAAVAEGGRAAGVAVLAFGPAGRLGEPQPGSFEVVDAPVYVSNEEEPALGVRSKEDASIVQAARAVAGGRADALVSAGSTGAALAAALLHVRRLKGVHRPALAAVLPVPGAPTVFLDVGANVEVRPEHLTQFAFMGAAFAQAVLGVERPRVGLLSIGEERSKGTETVVAAHARLSEVAADAPFAFVGHVEGGDVVRAAADVVVTDGFTGNVALKLMEGTVGTVVGAIRQAIKGSPVSALGGLLIRGRLGRLRADLDPDTHGGAILLGLRRPVVVAHGGASREGIANAVRLARRAADERMVERTAESLTAAGVVRSGPTATVEP